MKILIIMLTITNIILGFKSIKHIIDFLLDRAIKYRQLQEVDENDALLSKYNGYRKAL